MRKSGLSGRAILLAIVAMAAKVAAASTGQSDEDTQALPTVLVTADADVSAQTATKTNTPLIELPQAMSVVPATTIEEQSIKRLADALRAVAGVSRSSTYGYYDAYSLRGYDAAYGSVYLDGLTTTSVSGTTHELSGLEQVEVIKGPAAALFGASPLGGVVNLVSKRPRPARFLETDLSTGSYNLIEGSLDANSPLNASGSLLGRLNVLYRDADDFVDYSGENRLFLAPALTWSAGAGTQLTLLGRYQRDRDNPWSPLTAYGTVLPSVHGKLPPEFAVNRDGAQRVIANQDRQQLGYVLEHAFNAVVALSQTLRYTRTKTFWDNWIFSDEFVDSGFVDGAQSGRILGLYVYGPFRQTDDDLGVDSRLHIRFSTGMTRHALMAGIDVKRNGNRFSDGGGNFDFTANTLDILNPTNVQALIHDPLRAYSGSGRSRATGFYLQDHVGVAERVFVTLGGRWDRARTDLQKDHAFSPNVGINYSVTPGIALYANWSKPFTPQFSWVLNSNGAALPPESGRNLEAGVKWGDVEGSLNGLISIFQLTRTNVATQDPQNPFFYVVTGQQRSRGLEIEGSWKPVPAWQANWAYSYIDAQVTRDNIFATGTRLPNVPRHNLYVYGKYEIQQGALARLGLSVGALYNSSKNSSLSTADIDGDGLDDPAVPLPEYMIIDAGISYRLSDWETRLALNNVLDERYYPDAGYYTRITPGEPRNWLLSVSRKF